MIVTSKRRLRPISQAAVNSIPQRTSKVSAPSPIDSIMEQAEEGTVDMTAGIVMEHVAAPDKNPNSGSYPDTAALASTESLASAGSTDAMDSVPSSPDRAAHRVGRLKRRKWQEKKGLVQGPSANFHKGKGLKRPTSFRARCSPAVTDPVWTPSHLGGSARQVKIRKSWLRGEFFATLTCGLYLIIYV
jgi:hypothetical protein